MENNESFTLIDGRFDPDDALNLISTMFGAKIEYHTRNIVRAYDGNERDLKEDKKVKELRNARQEFQQKMREAKELGYQVEIKSIIVLNFVDTDAQSA